MGFEISEKLLRRLYVELSYSDKEIAYFFKVNRTTIVRLRERYKINARIGIGEIGEKFTIKKLGKLGYEVTNMNSKDKTSLFDILVNNHVRIEVKTARFHKTGFYFTLTNKPECENIESKNRITLPNGRSKKLYSKTCDLIVCLGVRDNKVFPYIIPSDFIGDSLQTIYINPESNGKYRGFFRKWDLFEKAIKKPTAPTVD